MKQHSMRLLAFLLSALLLIGCIPFTVSAEGETASELSNLAYILNNPKDTDLRIVYLGGSVTRGAGATSADETSWRALVGKWFTDTVGTGTAYNKTVTNIDAAIGATGSYFGAYRFYRDGKCDEGTPDVLFLEFSINDGYDSINGTQAAIYYESIIRQAYKINPKIQIIPVFTTDVTFANNYLKNGTEGWDCFEAHRRLAEHYKLPQVNIGRALVDAMAAESGQSTFAASDAIWKKYVTDSCHPNDAGYKIYADTVIDYLNTQLFGDVTFSGTYDDVVLPSVYSDEAKLITHGRYISFKDAGFTSDDLNGYQLTTTDSESYKETTNGKITSNNRNASFAYTFTGRGTGFYNFGYPESGKLKWTITATDDASITYSGETSLIKNYSTGLPIPASLMTGLANREWRVECVLGENAKGVRADLRYIYVDGDPASVKPAAAPATKVSYPPTVVKASALTGCSFDGNGTLAAAADKAGLSARAFVPNYEKGGVVALNWWNALQYNIAFPATRYIALTYYYEDGTNSAAHNVTAGICQVGNSGWISGSADAGDSGWKYTRRSAPVVTGKWVTQYYDYSDTADWLATTYPGQNLRQLYVFGYGTNGKPANIPNGQLFYLNSITFSHDLPMLYNEAGEAVMQNDGSAIAYVSASGSVTADGKTYDAYESLFDAVTALCPVGGTVKFTGEQTFFESAEARGAITLIGLDSTAKLTNDKFSLAGDLYVDNLTMEGAGWESWTCTNGHKLTFGKNFKNNKEIYYGKDNNGKANRIDFYNGTFGQGGAATYYQRTFTVEGDTEYNYFGGSYKAILAISRNGNAGAAGGLQTVNGDIFLNLYGGSFTSILPNQTVGIQNGSTFITVNGGNISGSIGYGSVQKPVVSETRKSYTAGDYVIIFNNKEIKENGGKITAAIGKGNDNATLETAGKKIIVSNNHELIINTGVSIGDTAADSVLLVSGGKAELVRGDDGLVKTFKLIPDEDGAVAYKGSEKYLPDEDGTYTLENGTAAITFKAGNSLDVIYSDGAGNTVSVVGKENGKITMPQNTFTKNGFVFAGWETEGDTSVYYPGDTYTLGEQSVTFTARWINRNEIQTVYVKQSAEFSGIGVAAESPVKTIAEAINVGGASRDFTVMFLDNYNESLTGDYAVTGVAHTGTITYSSADGGSLGWKSMFATKGPAVFENITLKVLASNNFVVNDGYPVVYGQNVTLASCDGVNIYKPQFHIGLQNKDTPFQTFRMDGGKINVVYVGPFYVSKGNSRNGAGADVTVNGGVLNRLTIGPDSYGEIIGTVNFTGPVTVTYNGGLIDRITKGTPAVTFAETQFIANNGLTFPELPTETDNGKRYIVNSAVGGMVYATDTVGTFRITSETGKLYIDGVKTAVSADHLYTLTPGTHSVTYTATLSVTADGKGAAYDEENGTITIGANSTAAFTESSIADKEGKLFLGWYKNGTAVQNGDALTAGDVLTAKYIEVNERFNILGAQIRLTGAEGLRFVNEMSVELLNEIKASGVGFKQETSSNDDNTGCGFAVLPTDMLADGEKLTKATAKVGIVPAKKIFAADERAIRYTVCITDIAQENYARSYTVAPYISYNNANGVEYTFYGEQYGTSLAAIAKAILSDGSATLTDEQKQRLEAFAAAQN